MGCAEYQERINELALAPAGTRPEPSLAQHLVVCNACGEELAQRQALLARIDLGVAALVATDAPQSLAARVRQQIAAEEARPRSMFGAYRRLWLAGAGTAIATAAILLALSVRTNRGPAAPQNIVAKVLTSPGAIPRSTAPNSAAAPKEASGREVRPAPIFHDQLPAFPAITMKPPAAPAQPDPMAAQLAAIEATPSTLEVLIPGNQPIAVHQIVFAARHDQLDENLLAKSEAKPIDPLEVKPIKIDLIAPPDGPQSNPGSGTGSR